MLILIWLPEPSPRAVRVRTTGQHQKMYTGLSSLQASPEAKAIEVIYNKVNVNIMFLMLLKLVLLLYITLDQQG